MAGKQHRSVEELDVIADRLYYLRMAKFVFYFYAFLSFVFWFLNCFEVDWLYHFTGLFIIPYKIVHMFYQVDGVSVDFSLAIIGCISLFIGFTYDYFLNSMYQKVLDEQDREIRRLEQRKIQKRKSIVKPVAGAAEKPQNTEFEDSKLLFLIQPHVNKIKKKQTDMELTFQEVEIWKQRINKKILENVSYSNPIQKGYYRKNLFLMYKDFNTVDDFLYYLHPTIDATLIEFKKYGIFIYFNYVLSALTKTEYLEKELDIMDTILSLNFRNEFIVTSRFKINYENKPAHRYKMKLKGEYNLSKNLSISNNQSIFSLESEK